MNLDNIDEFDHEEFTRNNLAYMQEFIDRAENNPLDDMFGMLAATIVQFIHLVKKNCKKCVIDFNLLSHHDAANVQIDAMRQCIIDLEKAKSGFNSKLQ